MGSIYESVPLDTGASTNIRLIEILPASLDGSDPISCKLHVVFLSLEEPVPYTALSYMWGSPDDTETILLNGEPFPARKNLVNFLHQARPRRPGLLWIDALCIDQSSINERNHQVSIMKHIYSSAENVIVWLGRISADVQSALEILPELDDEDDENDDADGVNNPRWVSSQRGMDYLCSSQYWCRIWIVQEYVLAKHIDIWCGAVTLDGEYLARTLIFRSPSLTPTIHLQATNVVLFRLDRLTIGLTSGLDYLLSKFWKMQCIDARDRVYALLSLIRIDMLEQLGIVPDYSKSAVEVFQQVHRAFLKCNIYQDFRQGAEGLVTTLCLALNVYHDDMGRKEWMNAIREIEKDILVKKMQE